jgi:DNA replication protein DnaC
MPNYDIYEKAKATIEARRNNAIAEADGRNEIVRAESEEIAKIDEELATTGMLIFKTACMGGDITPIKERNKELQAKRRELIVGLGYPADYTDLKYTCPDCSDTGFIDGTKTCHCLKELIIKGRIEASAMGRLLEKQSFDNFDLDWYAYDEKIKERMKVNLAVAKNYVRDFNKKQDNLLLIGSTGTGKTHISTAIARELIHKGYDVIYDSTQNIISDFESDRFRNSYGREENKSEKYLDCRLLIIDDLGTEFSNQFTLSTIYNLLNTRQNKGLPTIISTNLSPEELARKYEDRIYSRIIGSDCKVLAFIGKDKRVSR